MPGSRMAVRRMSYGPCPFERMASASFPLDASSTEYPAISRRSRTIERRDSSSSTTRIRTFAAPEIPSGEEATEVMLSLSSRADEKFTKKSRHRIDKIPAMNLHVEPDVHDFTVLHDVLLPLEPQLPFRLGLRHRAASQEIVAGDDLRPDESLLEVDRKSTRLNSSHSQISY